MSDQPTSAPSAPSPMAPAGPSPAAPTGEPKAVPEKPPLLPMPRSWWVATTIAGIMVLLALLGVGLTTSSKDFAPTYWISLVPVFGLLCVGTAWARAQHGQGFAHAAVVRQVLHWLGIGVALGLDFLIRGTGVETGTASGLNALLVLALGCYLAGVHLEWTFAIVGVLLTVALICVAKADEYLWVIFIVGAIAIAVMVGLQLLFLWANRRKGDTVGSHALPAGS